MRDIEVSTRGHAASLLRSARSAAGLSQVRLARLAGTTQSAIAAYEGGAREPTVPVLARLCAAAASRLVLGIEPDPALYRLVDVARHIAEADPNDEARRLRMVFEFIRSANDDGHPLVLLVAAKPASTGDTRFDALLAAVAEHLCVHADEAPPSWVHDTDRFLSDAWWVSNLPSGRAAALVHSPASFRRRGVMLDRHDMEAA